VICACTELKCIITCKVRLRNPGYELVLVTTVSRVNS